MIKTLLFLLLFISCTRIDVELKKAAISTPTSPAPAPVSIPFIMSWSIPNALKTVTLPLNGASFTYDFKVDWGDGTPEEVFTNANLGAAAHTYASAGAYDIKISGALPYLGQDNLMSCPAESRLLDVKQWGNNKWQSLKGMFCGATHLNFTATDTPDLSLVTDMSGLFKGATRFNSNLNAWDVSTVTNMTSLFEDAFLFNQPLSSWNTSSVINMSNTFKNTHSFNKALPWNVSQVTDMSGMFFNAQSFHQDISAWNVSNVTNMSSMFEQAWSFHGEINNWDVTKVTDMSSMFNNARSFDQPLHNWNVSNVQNMTSMFGEAWSMTQDLSCWQLKAGVTSTTFAPTKNMGFSLPVFGGSPTANCVVLGNKPTPTIADSTWFVTTWKVTAANQNIIIRMPNNSSGVNGYNINVDWGDGSNVENLLFTGTTNTTISHLYATPGYYHIRMKAAAGAGAGLQTFGTTTTNCTKVSSTHSLAQLVAVEQWGTNPWRSLAFSFCGASNVTVPATDAPVLSNLHGNSSGLRSLFEGATKINESLNHWDVSAVKDLQGTFAYAYQFNQPLDQWNTSSVIKFSSMFSRALNFNQPLASLNTSMATAIVAMFHHAINFNQNINTWDVSKVLNYDFAFGEAYSFNQSLSNWSINQSVSLAADEVFYMSYNFNQNLSCWNVANKSAPDNFFSEVGPNAVAPVWGTSGITGGCSSP